MGVAWRKLAADDEMNMVKVMVREIDYMSMRVLILGLLAAAVIALSACGGGEGAVDAGDGATALAETEDEALTAQELIPLLTRNGVGPQGAQIDVTYAPPRFFDITGLKRPAEMDSRPTLAFILQQTVHDGDLPIEPPQVFLEPASGDPIAPYSAEVTAEDPHHRTVRLLFPQPDGWDESSAESSVIDTLVVVVPREDGTASVGNTFAWQLPIDLGDVSEGEDG